MIIITGSVTARPDSFDEVLALSLAHVHRSRLEPGCLAHAVHRDIENPMKLVFFEQWADQASVDAHFAVPESGEFVNGVLGLSEPGSPPSLEVFAAHVASRTRPGLDMINLVVEDMPATVAFYRRLGLKIDDEPAPWDRHHRSADMAGGIDLDFDSRVFAKVWNEGLRPDGGTVVGFKLANRQAVDDKYAELTGAGYVGQQPPYDAFWGARYAIVEDPDGSSIGLMSPVDPEQRRPPPALPE